MNAYVPKSPWARLRRLYSELEHLRVAYSQMYPNGWGRFSTEALSMQLEKELDKEITRATVLMLRHDLDRKKRERGES